MCVYVCMCVCVCVCACAHRNEVPQDNPVPGMYIHTHFTPSNTLSISEPAEVDPKDMFVTPAMSTRRWECVWACVCVLRERVPVQSESEGGSPDNSQEKTKATGGVSVDQSVSHTVCTTLSVG